VPDPAHTVGAALEVSGLHPGRSGRDHLRSLAAMARIPASRVEELLALVELTPAAGRRAGKYSMGMRQRRALAATLLGDPQVLVLDEPANGLDPQGIRWLRDFLRTAAAEGRTVLVSPGSSARSCGSSSSSRSRRSCPTMRRSSRSARRRAHSGARTGT
jgi:ABC-2 type transport system ATP-binding protein